MMGNDEIVEKLQKYSRQSFIRVYPFGLRFGSSNFNPLPMMKCGAQLISLNTQNYDTNYTALKSHFFLNNNCGSVASSFLATAPAATRAVVSRALDLPPPR